MSFKISSLILLYLGYGTSVGRSSSNFTYNNDWNDAITCSDHTIVTGFHLSYDYEDPENDEDKTILNRIWLGCGHPFQSESNQEKHVSWITDNSTIFGYDTRKLFCSGYTVGFRLRMRNAKQFTFRQGESPSGIVNVKMICDDGEEIEGHDEKWDYYPDADYLAEPHQCPEHTAVCGIETETAEVKQTGLAKTISIQNLRVQCCQLNELTTPKYASPFTPSPRNLNVTLFDTLDGVGGRNETISIKSNQCNPVPLSWLGNVVALEQKSICLRVWEKTDCTGHTRCFCETDFLFLTDSLRMSANSSWQNNVNALSMCFVENERNFTRALIFSGRNYTEGKDTVVLAPEECLTFYKGDKWHGKVESLIVTDGCMEYFDEEECKGEFEQVDGFHPKNDLAASWGRQIKSFRNCAIRHN